MIKRIFEDISGKWQTFSYNYKWSDYVWMFDGWIAKASLMVPFIGYLILFNDYVVENLTFEHITQQSNYGLSSTHRLKLIYFGLLFLGLSNLIFLWRRPWVFKLGKNEQDFIKNGLDYFTARDYLNFHHEIQRGHFTQDGKYYTAEWDSFWGLITGKNDPIDGFPMEAGGHLNDAKNRHEGLIRSILRETYFRTAIQRRKALTVCIVLSGAGLVCLSVPSIDLFVKILLTTF